MVVVVMMMMMMMVTVMTTPGSRAEVEAVLSECREEDDSCATLARLKMAIEYEEKKVSNDTKAIRVQLRLFVV